MKIQIKKIKRIGIELLFVVFLSGQLFAVTERDGLAMPLMQSGNTARAMSMGSAVVGVPLGLESLFWNPAGLASMSECLEMGLHHNTALGDSNHEIFVVGVPMMALGNFAGSLQYVDNGNFEGRDDVGNPTGDYKAGNMGGVVGWGNELLPGVSAGVAVKYNEQTIDDKKYTAFATDIGVLWNLFSSLNLGLSYSNFGNKIAGYTLDSGLRVGGSYVVIEKVLLALSTELKPSGIEIVNMGVEGLITPEVSLRAGYDYNIKDTELTGLRDVTAGFGIKINRNFSFDYAYVPYGDLGDSQRISLNYKFCKEKEESVPMIVEATVIVVQPEEKTVVVAQTEAIVIEKVVALDDTHFKYDSSKLTRAGKKTILENIQVLKDNPKAHIRIEGYASASGTKEYNQALSERRAEAVRKILIKKGKISSKRLTTIGYGETRPAMFESSPNEIKSDEARANMRVLFEVIV